MASDVITLTFIVGAIVLLALLWRRGPEKRGPFFVAGLLLVGGSVTLWAAMDDIEELLDEAVAGWQGHLANRPSQQLATPKPTFKWAEAGGVALEYPGKWRPQSFASQERLFPSADDDVRWEPLIQLRRGNDTCTLVDATDFAHELDLGTLEDVVQWEVEGLDDPDPMSRPRLTERLTSFPVAVIDPDYVELRGRPIAVVDASAAAGRPSARIHIMDADGHWLYLSCETMGKPFAGGSWVTEIMAASVTVEDGGVATDRPTMAPSLPPALGSE